MTSWPTRPLGDLVRPTEIRDPTKTPADEFFYVDIASIDNETKTIIGAKEITGVYAPTRARKVIRDGDVIVSTVRPNLNAVALVSETFDNQICSTGFSVLRPARDILSRYLFAFVRSRYFVDALVRKTTGASYPAITDAEVRAVLVPVPPLAEQQRIARLVDDSDELRKLRARADSRTDQLIPALFQEMFGDPARNLQGWPIRSAGELMEACDYGSSKKADKTGRGVPVLRMGNVTVTGNLDLEDLKNVELPREEFVKQQLRTGDVLFNRTNSRDLVGKTGMWDGRFTAVAASYFIRMRFLSGVEHPQHFTTFMNLPFMKHKLAAMARGAIGQANINSQELKSIPVPVPPFAMQEEFAQRVTEVRELEATQAASRLHFEALFQSVLHDAFDVAA